MKKLLKLLVFSGSLLLLVACGKEAPAADRSPGKLSKQSPDQPAQLSGPGIPVSAPSVAARTTSRPPGKLFKDCPECPEMVAIPAGSFEMGGTYRFEQPVHRVTLRSFSMGKTEVTRGQWRAIMGSTPPYSAPPPYSDCSDDCPISRVSWEDAKEFVSRLSAKTGKTYRLPSEAEWEYACRAGGREEYCGGNNVDDVGWHHGNSGAKLSENVLKTFGPTALSVAEKQANAWGLHDMSGNVEEWTEDCWNENYTNAPADGSAWTQGDCSLRVARGGSFRFPPESLRSATRDKFPSAFRLKEVGFRVAMSPTTVPSSASVEARRIARGDAPATLPKSVAQSPSAAADNVTSLNCVLSNKVFGVGGWRVVLNTTKMTASASFIGTPNSWFGLTGILLDTTYPLTADNSSDAGSFYTFGLLEGQNYRLFVINRENLQFRYAASDTGMTDWGRCNRTPVIVPL